MRLRNLLVVALIPVGFMVSRVDSLVSRADDPPVTPTTRAKGVDVAKQPTYQTDVLPFLKAHCFTCHGNGKTKADLSFDKYTDEKSMLADRKKSLGRWLFFFQTRQPTLPARTCSWMAAGMPGEITLRLRLPRRPTIHRRR